MVTRRFLSAFLLIFGLAAGIARADGPLDFTTVKLAGAGGSSEPRMTVAPDGTRYLNTTGPRNPRPDLGWPAYVYSSRDEGQTWQRTPSDPPQARPSIDVDTIAMPTGRILASELDYGGLNFPTGVSDDGAKTWTESVGPRLVDQDRQWFAAGPNNPVGAVWIDLSKDTYGIHGTPDPDHVGKTASHGCVRGGGESLASPR